MNPIKMQRLLLIIVRIGSYLTILISILWAVSEPSYESVYTLIAGVIGFSGTYIRSDFFYSKEKQLLINKKKVGDLLKLWWLERLPEKNIELFFSSLQDHNTLWGYRNNFSKRGSVNDIEAIVAGLVILGQPGVGKTTTLIQLANKMIATQDGDMPIPVILRLNSWTNRYKNFLDWAAKEISTRYEIPYPNAQSLLQSGQFILFLDALDEVPKERQTQCIESINNMMADLGVSIVMSCRLKEYQSLEAKLSTIMTPKNRTTC